MDSLLCATHSPEHGPGSRRIHRHGASTSDPAPTRCRNRTGLSGVGAACGCFTYLVAYAVDDERAYLQDPAGFPWTALDREDLTRAWRADRIGAPGGPFRRWLRPRRVARPTSRQLYDDAIEFFGAAYRDLPPGDAVIRALAKHLRPGQVAEGERGFLTAFVFPWAPAARWTTPPSSPRAATPSWRQPSRARPGCSASACWPPTATTGRAWPTPSTSSPTSRRSSTAPSPAVGRERRAPSAAARPGRSRGAGPTSTREWGSPGRAACAGAAGPHRRRVHAAGAAGRCQRG